MGKVLILFNLRLYSIDYKIILTKTKIEVYLSFSDAPVTQLHVARGSFYQAHLPLTTLNVHVLLKGRKEEEESFKIVWENK